jgi:hypothetical protein
VTLDGNQLFALESFSFGAAKPLDGVQASGNLAFNTLRLSFGDAALNPSLFSQLANGTAFREVDVLKRGADAASRASHQDFWLLHNSILLSDAVPMPLERPRLDDSGHLQR